jgi:hypothetical protein
MWVMFHTKSCGVGCNPCGKPAIKAVRKPHETDRVTPELLRNLDGSIPQPTDLLLCQSCWKPICQIHADDFVEEAE